MQRAQARLKQSCCQSGSCSTGSVEGKDDDGLMGVAPLLLQESHLGLQPPFENGGVSFQRLFYYFLLFRFWRLLPKEILFFLSRQHKVASPLDYF